MVSPMLTLTLALTILMLLGPTRAYEEGMDEDGDDGMHDENPCSSDGDTFHEGEEYRRSYEGDDYGGDEYHPDEGNGNGCGTQAKAAPPKQILFMDLIITLDGSSATGQSTFTKTQQFIIMMLKTYKLGGNSLRIKVVYSNSANIQIFTFDNDAQTQSYISQINGCSYSGATLDILLIFQNIQSFYLSFQRSGAGRCLFLMGGFNVGNSWEIKTRVALYVQTISINFRFYYFAIGSQISLSFWGNIMDQNYIIQISSFSVTSSWTISWFQTNKATFTIYGLWRNMKSVNVQLALTLDGSTATGKEGYYKTFSMILTLLRTHTLGSGNLQLYVCVHRGGQVNVVQFKSPSDISVNLNLLSTQYWTYTGVSANVVMILQKVQWVVQNSFSSSQPKSIWLTGGMQVTGQQQQTQVKMIMYQLEVKMKTYFYYYAVGVQKSTSFWIQVLGQSNVKTDFTITVSSFNSLLLTCATTASNLGGPVVTTAISSVNKPRPVVSVSSSNGHNEATEEGHMTGDADSHHGEGDGYMDGDEGGEEGHDNGMEEGHNSGDEGDGGLEEGHNTGDEGHDTGMEEGHSTGDEGYDGSEEGHTTGDEDGHNGDEGEEDGHNGEEEEGHGNDESGHPSGVGTVQGPGPAVTGSKTKAMFLELIITLDGSSATGQSAFNRIQQFIVTLLKTYQLGGNSLRIKVIYSGGSNIQIFTFDNDAQTQSYISKINGCSYSGSNQNVIQIFQNIQSIYLSFQRSGAGRCLLMMGGFNVGNPWETKAKVALYVQTISNNFRFYYFAIGSQTSLSFWRDMMDQTYIMQLNSFGGTSSWTINWFQSNTASFTVYGLWKNMKFVNIQLALTLDGSMSTGVDGYYKTFYMILTLLRTHTLGSGSLQLYVCVYRGGQVEVMQLRSTADISVNLNMFSSSYLNFPNASPNVVLVLQKVQWVVQNSFSSSQPKSIWLCGGMQVSNQQQQVKQILYQLEVTQKTYFYYYAMGKQTDTSFWVQALGQSFVKTSFSVSVMSFNNFLSSCASTASNLMGPTVTSIISSMGFGMTGSMGGWSSGGTTTTHTVSSMGSQMVSGGGPKMLSARIVNGVTQVPKAMNVRGTGCMTGTMDVGQGYCAINNMDAFKMWARSAGFNVRETNMNGIQTISISGTVSYGGKK